MYLYLVFLFSIGLCLAAGVGYTWDDQPSRAQPVVYGCMDPIAFVTQRQR